MHKIWKGSRLLLFFELAGRLNFIVLLISPLLPPLPVVAVNVAILAHAVGVELIMRAVPGLLIPSVLVVAVAAHALGVVLLLRVPAVIGLLSSLINILHFLLGRLHLAVVLGLVRLGQLLDLLQALQLLGEELDVEVHVLVDQLLLLCEHLHPRLLGRLVSALGSLLPVRERLGRRQGGVLDDLLGVEGFGGGDFQS